MLKVMQCFETSPGVHHFDGLISTGRHHQVGTLYIMEEGGPETCHRSPRVHMHRQLRRRPSAGILDPHVAVLGPGEHHIRSIVQEPGQSGGLAFVAMQISRALTHFHVPCFEYPFTIPGNHR